MSRIHIEEFYQHYFQTPFSLAETDPQMAYIQHFLPSSPDSPILDAGCGDGRYADSLVRQGFSQVLGVDLFKPLHSSREFSYVRASIENLPFNSQAFSLVLCLSALFYLPDPHSSIRELFRIIRPNGFLVISAHTRYSLFTLFRRFQRWLLPWRVPHLKGIPFLSASEYALILRQEGFQVVWVDGFRLSFLWWDVLSPLFERFTGRKPPPLPSFQTFPFRWYARLRSILGYHSILVARKSSGGETGK